MRREARHSFLLSLHIWAAIFLNLLVTWIRRPTPTLGSFELALLLAADAQPYHTTGSVALIRFDLAACGTAQGVSKMGAGRRPHHFGGWSRKLGEEERLCYRELTGIIPLDESRAVSALCAPPANVFAVNFDWEKRERT